MKSICNPLKKYSLLISLAIVVFITSCQKKDTTLKPTEEKPSMQKCECENEVAFPEIKGEVISLRDKNNQENITLIKKNDKYILGGDIILTEEQVNYLKNKLKNPDTSIKNIKVATPIHSSLPKYVAGNNRTAPHKKITSKDTIPININRTGMASLANLWPNKTVFYTINSSLPDQARVTNAIAHWQSQTNILFVQRTTQANYIEFVPGSGCASYYGMRGGRQEIYLASGCNAGIIVHEIGHALGFFHEQARADRNNFVIINANNITPGFESNFYTYIEADEPGFEIGGFDFNSIMLYDSYAFSSNGLPTITKLDGSTFTSQRDGLSAGDIETYNYMYNPPFIRRTEVVNVNWYDQVTGSYRYEATLYITFYSDAAGTIPFILQHPIYIRGHSYWEFPLPGVYLENSNVTFRCGPGASTFNLGKTVNAATLLNEITILLERSDFVIYTGVGYIWEIS